MSIPTNMLLLMNKPNASAPEITSPLKDLGDGSMQEGLKRIYRYGFQEGKLSCRPFYAVFAIGGIGIGVLITKAIDHYKQHQAEKQIITNAFEGNMNHSISQASYGDYSANSDEELTESN